MKKFLSMKLAAMVGTAALLTVSTTSAYWGDGGPWNRSGPMSWGGGYPGYGGWGGYPGYGGWGGYPDYGGWSGYPGHGGWGGYPGYGGRNDGSAPYPGGYNYPHHSAEHPGRAPAEHPGKAPATKPGYR